MTTEYVVLGAVLVVMGAVQVWLRYGPWAKEQKKAEMDLARRRARKAKAAAEDSGADEGPVRAEEPAETAMVIMQRGTKVWNTWTAILGPLGIAFGLALVVVGALGV